MTFEFPVVLKGQGKNIHEAWLDAVEQFNDDPGVPPDVAPVKEEKCVCGCTYPKGEDCPNCA